MDPMYFESWKHEDVTLATQCSANHLHHVIELAKRWSGRVYDDHTVATPLIAFYAHGARNPVEHELHLNRLAIIRDIAMSKSVELRVTVS